MNELTFRKVDLIENIERNREAHRKLFEEALTGYREEMHNLLEVQIDTLKKGKLPIVSGLHIPVPVDHTSDYDRVLRMLNMTVDVELIIREREFAQYVLDDWDWKQQFLETASEYTGGWKA